MSWREFGLGGNDFGQIILRLGGGVFGLGFIHTLVNLALRADRARLCCFEIKRVLGLRCRLLFGSVSSNVNSCDGGATSGAAD